MLFVYSYVQKNSAAPGADPIIALPTPRYTPVKPPEARNPDED
jgi:hypothetical protein